jgi:hypothetical protein
MSALVERGQELGPARVTLAAPDLGRLGHELVAAQVVDDRLPQCPSPKPHAVDWEPYE